MLNQRFLTINEFRKTYGTPDNFLRREVKLGNVPGFRSGNRFYIDSSSYLEILSAGGKRRIEL